MKYFSLLLLLMFAGFSSWSATNPKLQGSYRENKAGWVFVHLQGSPADIGYQEGYLLSNEIDDGIRAEEYMLLHTTGKDWNWYRNVSKRMMWDKVPKEYQVEMSAMAAGMRAKGKKEDVWDVLALNASTEISGYYLPMLENEEHPGLGDNKAPANCSAFIATGSYTKDGKIVMGHNCWTDYMTGERYNVIVDIVPEKGYHIMMDIYPGFIDSGDDFAENSAGILITETTIVQFKGFDTTGIPEFVRARETEQYANSIN
ncbi:MAG: C45 family autoproteolytic acyltransferase/hydrolase, partial [Chitinophagaceae bacterium]